MKQILSTFNNDICFLINTFALVNSDYLLERERERERESIWRRACEI